MTVRVRRLACPVLGCWRQCDHSRRSVSRCPVCWNTTSAERVASQSNSDVVVKELAGRAASRLLMAPAAPASRSTALRMLLRVSLPARQVPQVLGVDDFALRRRTLGDVG